MTSYETLPVSMFIKQFNCYEDLKNEILQPNKYNISLKENDDICMLYYNTNLAIDDSNNSNNQQRDPNIIKFEVACRNAIIEKSTLKLLLTQYNKILYNSETKQFLKDKSFKNGVIQKCYEGTLILVFNHNNKWYVTTRRCIDATESIWVDGKSYYELFVDAMQNKFTFDDLNINYCYQFILVHHKNKNIVSYDSLGNEYKELFHSMTNEKYTLNEVEHKLNNVKYIPIENFNNFDELENQLKIIDESDRNNRKVTLEGYVIRYYDNETHTGPYTLMKLQTNIYDRLMKIKPNNSNLHQGFLELYQTDNLNEFLPYFTTYIGEVVRRINNSMKTISTEILNLYHMTRNKSNSDLYNMLPDQYKRVLYEIHGIYIKNKQQDNNDKPELEMMEDNEQSKNIKRTINVYDIYHYLKQLSPNKLRQLYYDRHNIITNNEATKFPFINTHCIYTMTQSILMYKNAKNVKNVKVPKNK